MQLIKFDKTTKTFTIENNDISYIFYVNHENILVNLYFGKKINQLSKDSYEFINNMYADKYTYFDINKKEEVINDQYFSGIASRVEIPSFGTFEKRIAATGGTPKGNGNYTAGGEISKEAFRAMTLSQQMDLYKQNPDLYKKLTTN